MLVTFSGKSILSNSIFYGVPDVLLSGMHHVFDTFISSVWTTEAVMLMSSEESEASLPREKRERLVIVLHPKRASMIFFYVFSTALTIVGVGFMNATAYGAIPPAEISWAIGNAAIIVGIILFAITEMKRFFTLYIITTWNVRTRKGIIWRKTVRVFYDQISECRSTIYHDERRVGMGDVEIFSNLVKNGPTLVFEETENPDGIREIITRFMQTIPYPLPWAHIQRE
jgi:hypothetical protein